MALRKIKDLIREMVFKNQSNVHQYAEVMANLVFDMNKFDEYDAKLDETEQNAAKYDDEIQQINAYIKQQKEALDELISKKKSGKLLSEDEKANLINLNKTIGQQTKRQRETIAEKIQKGFVNLEPVIKKYACLRYLSNEYVKNADFKTEIGADGFIYADEYEFKSSEMARNFREISDYVDYIFGNRNSKITEPKSIVEIIKRDATELNLPVEKLTPSTIVEIYNSLLERIAEENRNKQSEKEQIELSQIGIEPIQDFGDGLVMYRLLPDTEYYNEHHEHRNLVYESDQMGICIGNKEQSYSQKIFDLEKNQYYTLRKKQPNGQLMPHCTIEVNGDIVSQVKGKSNGTVNGNYIQPVREFLKQHLNVAFPGEENTKNKRELYDYSNIGFVKDLHDNTVDVFNLPPNTELGKISYDLLSIKGIDLKNVKLIEELSCYGCKITQQGLEQIKNNNLIKSFDLLGANLSGTFDFSNEKDIYLADCDLSNAEIKFNPNAEKINLGFAKGLHGTYDFSGVKKLYLTHCDLSNVTKIIVNQQLFDDIVGSIHEDYWRKIVVTKPESKVDLLNKGITNLKNRLNIETQQPKEKISVSDREND